VAPGSWSTLAKSSSISSWTRSVRPTPSVGGQLLISFSARSAKDIIVRYRSCRGHQLRGKTRLTRVQSMSRSVHELFVEDHRLRSAGGSAVGGSLRLVVLCPPRVSEWLASPVRTMASSRERRPGVGWAVLTPATSSSVRRSSAKLTLPVPEFRLEW
jgi:hypothetical protein